MAMTQKQFTTAVTELLNDEFDYGLSKRDTENVLDAISSVLEHEVQQRRNDGVVVVRGIGRVRLKKVPARKARPGVNPATGEAITISAKPASKKLVITFDKALRDALGSK